MYPMRTKILTMLKPRRREGASKQLDIEKEDDNKIPSASRSRRDITKSRSSRYIIHRKKATETAEENRSLSRDSIGHSANDENSTYLSNVNTLSDSCLNQCSESLENLTSLAESTEMNEYIRICGAVGENARSSRRHRKRLCTADTQHELPVEPYPNNHVTFKYPDQPSSGTSRFAKRRQIQTTKSVNPKNDALLSSHSSQLSSNGSTAPILPECELMDSLKRYLDDYVVLLPTMGTTVKELRRKGKVQPVHRRRAVRAQRSSAPLPQFHSMEERCKFYWESNRDSDSDVSSDDEGCPKSREVFSDCDRNIGVENVDSVPKKNEHQFKKIPVSNYTYAPVFENRLSLLPPTQTPLKNNKRAPIYIPYNENHVTLSGALVDYSFSDAESTCTSRDWDAVLGVFKCQSAVTCEDDAMESFMNSKLHDNSDSDEGLSSMNSVEFFTV